MEEESAVPTSRAPGTHSCTSLIRHEQEAKREQHARVQEKRRRGNAMPGKKISDEVLDLAEYTKNQPWWRKLFGPSSGSSTEKYNVATQLAIGGVTGWCTGFIFQKVGKLAATAVGGGFFLLQIANHTGYIKVDWQMVERDVSKAKEQLKFHGSNHNQLAPEVKSQVDEWRAKAVYNVVLPFSILCAEQQPIEVISFLKKNVLLTGGFVGGFLLGMAS